MKVADYAIVGDINKVIPEMISKLKESIDVEEVLTCKL